MIRPKPDPQIATGAAWHPPVPSPPTAAAGVEHANPDHYGDCSCCFTGLNYYCCADDLDDCPDSVTTTAASAPGLIATSEAAPVEQEGEEDDGSARLSVEPGHEHQLTADTEVRQALPLHGFVGMGEGENTEKDYEDVGLSASQRPLLMSICGEANWAKWCIPSGRL